MTESQPTMNNVVHRGGASTTRSFVAPTRAEADVLAGPSVRAFSEAGWRIDDQLWIPGDRRPTLVESLVLSPASENLLDADGTLRITFGNDASDAPVPGVAPAARLPDEFEVLGGTRYRRLAPRWILGGVVAIIGLLVMASMLGNFIGSPSPTPDAQGMCPIGWAMGWSTDASGTITSRFCSRLGP